MDVFMNVLITEFDLYSSKGGGQTYYRTLFEKHPDIYFYYFYTLKRERKIRKPSNVMSIPYKSVFGCGDNKIKSKSQFLWRSAYNTAENLVSSTGTQYFDIIEVPDYHCYGGFLKASLYYHKIKYGKLVLALHGNTSTTLEFGGTFPLVPIPCNYIKSLKYLERIQFESLDLRYGISETYIEEWNERTGINSIYFNIFDIFKYKTGLNPVKNKERPDLIYIGRAEVRKGADIFLEIVSHLPRNLYSKIKVIGSISYSDNALFYDMAAKRGLEIEIIGLLKPEKLKEHLDSNCFVFLPSRYDTLNLTALETLFAGIPTAVGSGAGVCRLLNNIDVPFVCIDVKKIYSCCSELIDVLNNYKDYRSNLFNKINTFIHPATENSLLDIYNTAPTSDSAVLEKMKGIYSRIAYLSGRDLEKASHPRRIYQYWISRFSVESKDKLKNLSKNVYKYISILNPGFINRKLNTSLNIISKIKHLNNLTNCLAEKDKITDNDIKDIDRLMKDVIVFKVPILKTLSKLELKREQLLKSAIYEIRIMRLLWHDHFGKLSDVCKTLKSNNYINESSILEAMYGNQAEEERHRKCLELLDKAYEVNKIIEIDNDYTVFDDRRANKSYKVSIIVSLYNAADKLAQFIDSISLQSLLNTGEVELIFIDSCSPTGEYAVFESYKRQSLPALYVRTHKRETIQYAWNRGINLSSGKYLCFLGVDETLFPNALEVLADTLDKDENIDWVQGNSLVSSVDRHGTIVKDECTYDRDSCFKEMAYLETCIVSWVGGMYRKSIHDRHGYYDPSFTAAGDTEFKNRVLPHINVKFIDKPLGQFWNYPDERTTANPRAEIEDIRAWYLHRTYAGVEYAFRNTDNKVVEKLFYKSLGYRKSYISGKSSDIDYACNLSDFLKTRNYKKMIMPDLNYMLKMLRELDSMDIYKLSGSKCLMKIVKIFLVFKYLQIKHRIIGISKTGCDMEPKYSIINDNRYQQHFWGWI